MHAGPFRLDEKLRRIRAGDYRPADFVIADAKDGDMSGPISTTGFTRAPDGGEGRRRTRPEFLDAVAAIVAQDAVDIMLVSASNLEALHARGVFANSAVKPAIRANDTTDVWVGVRHGTYAQHPSRPFRSADLGRVAAAGLTDLGLYSVTFTGDLDHDIASLAAYAAFRAEAAPLGFTHFLEVFNPNTAGALEGAALGEFINDAILRCLAGVLAADRPRFLKIVYNGPAALEELAGFDPGLVVGVLGGGAGTTRDTFELLRQAEKHGARIALFGRKINLAEDPLALLTLMRAVIETGLGSDEAVRAYHAELERSGHRPRRALAEDRALTDPLLRQHAD